MENQLPKRKPTRYPKYDYSQNGAYFVTICTQDRRKILCDIVGGGALDAPKVTLTNIGEIVQKHIVNGNRIADISVDNYVIMPDHIHLILSINQSMNIGTSRAPSPTNALIPHFVSTFKRFCHRDIGKTIFQRSYHDHVVRGEQDYLKIWNYIDTNPARWEKDCFYPYKENQS